MQRPVHLSLGQVKYVGDRQNITGQGWTVKKMNKQKQASNILDIVSYALKMGVTCL